MSYLDSLKTTINIWVNDKIEDEWLFEKFRESEIKKINSSDAFNFINDTIPILLDEKNRQIWTELFEIIICLARKSNTTEIPSKILENWESLKIISNTHSVYAQVKLKELASYYRLKHT